MTTPRLRSLKSTALALLCMACASHAADGDSAAEISRAQADAYKAAFEGNDAAALAALFTEDAQYNVDSGDSISGRKAIQERSEEFLSAYPDATIDIAIVSSRMLTPSVLVEKGFATVSGAGAGADETTQYTATQVKTDGKWLIADLQELTLPPVDAGTEALAQLSWMIGKWQTEVNGLDIRLEAIWSLDGKFITRTTRVPQKDKDPFVSVEIIGYDPVQARIHSWVFDNEGGHGSGSWRRDGNKWLVRGKATGPDGALSSAQHIVTVLEEDRFTLESINRVLDGELLPSRDKIEIVRSSGNDQPTKK